MLRPGGARRRAHWAPRRRRAYRALRIPACRGLSTGAFAVVPPELVRMSNQSGSPALGGGRIGACRHQPGGSMDHYDARTALEELREDAVLPHPVRVRDMIMRAKLDAYHALSLNREFQNYLSHFGETQKIAIGILEKLAVSELKAP